MAPSLITHYEVYSASADQTTLTTASFTPSNGEVVVVKLTTWGTADGMNAPTGGAQTYTNVGTAAPGGFNAWAGLWTATISGSPGSMTISSTVATAVNTRHSMVVERWSAAQLAGSPATNATKSGSGTTATTTLTTVAANSVVSWCMADENSRDPAASTYVSSSGTPTEDGKYDGHAGSNSVHYFAYQDAASIGSQTFGVTNASSLAWVAVGVEIEGSTVTAAATLTTTSTITAAGTNSAVGAASLSTTSTITAAGVNTAVGAATSTSTSAITAAGTNSAVGAATATTTTTITAAAVVGSVATLTTVSTITAAATVTRAAGAPRTGVTGWDLYSTLAQQAAYIDYYRTVPPVACPNDGEPLRSGPPAKTGVLYCPWGDFQYPRDWDPNVHGGM